MSNDPALPQDLLIRIINELSNDLNSLKALSLTSTSLRVPAQKHLFSSISVDTTTPITMLFVARLYNMVIKPVYPSIARHVTTLAIRMGEQDTFYPWFIQFLEEFEYLHTIVIRTNDGRWNIPSMMFSAPKEKKLYPFFNRRRITRMRVEYNVGQATLGVATTCSYRKVIGGTEADSALSGVDPTIPRYALESLHISWATKRYDLHILSLQNLIDRGTSSLTDVSLVFTEVTEQSEMISLKKVPLLKVLKLVIFVSQLGDALSPITRLLGSISEVGTDREADIHIQYTIPLAEGTLIAGSWNDFDTVLTGMVQTSVLQRIGLYISNTDKSQIEDGVEHEHIRN